MRRETVVEADDAIGFGALALVLFDGVNQATVVGPGAAIVQEENALADAPQGCGTEFVATGSALGDVVRETGTHVMHEQVRV